jgi:putative SOS response-associated peptidase YedK
VFAFSQERPHADDNGMCGRFTLFVEPKTVAAFVHAPEPTFDWEPRWNIAPTQPVVACRLGATHGHELARLRWGLIPSWAKDESAGVKAINASAETVAEKPFFRSALHKRRCLIPASGFYEWVDQKTGNAKQPFFIHPAVEELFAFAGLWETWSKAGSLVETCTIITTDANETMQPYHDRMPVILSPESFTAWLDLSTPSTALLDMLRPCPSGSLALHPVDARVGNVRNDDAGLVQPLAGLFPA